MEIIEGGNDVADFNINAATEMIEKITLDWPNVFSHTPPKTKRQYENDLYDQVYKFRNMPFFSTCDSEENMIWGSGKMTASIVFLMPFPRFIRQHDEHAFPSWNAEDIIQVCKKDDKYKEGDIYMMNYLPWEPTNLQGSNLDQVEYIEFFFPFLIRRLEIIKPATVVMIGVGIQKIIHRALLSKLRYMKQIKVIKTENYNVFAVKKNYFTVNFVNAPHLNLKREDDENDESYSNRKIQHLKNFEASVLEAYKLQKTASDIRNKEKNVFQMMKQGSLDFEKKQKTKKEKSEKEKEKREKKKERDVPAPLPKGQLTFKKTKIEIENNK